MSAFAMRTAAPSLAASSVSRRRASIVVRAEAEKSSPGGGIRSGAPKSSYPDAWDSTGQPQPKNKQETPKGWKVPELNPDWPSPIFGGSTGGLLRKAQVEEFYVITWEAKKEAIFEMPTGGAAIMRSGPNLLKLARKEQCLALETTLRSKFRLSPSFYRVFPDATVEYLHPKDGVYPEKVNPGRELVNCIQAPIGANAQPFKVKFSGKRYTFEV